MKTKMKKTMKKTTMKIKNKDSFSKNFNELDLNLHGVRLPSFDIEVGHKRKLGVSEDISNYNFLRELCKKGFKNLKVSKNSKNYKEYTERIKYELKTLKELGFVDYVLLVWDVVNFCKVNDIHSGLG